MSTYLFLIIGVTLFTVRPGSNFITRDKQRRGGGWSLSNKHSHSLLNCDILLTGNQRRCKNFYTISQQRLHRFHLAPHPPFAKEAPRIPVTAFLHHTQDSSPARHPTDLLWVLRVQRGPCQFPCVSLWQAGHSSGCFRLSARKSKKKSSQPGMIGGSQACAGYFSGSWLSSIWNVFLCFNTSTPKVSWQSGKDQHSLTTLKK